MGTVETLVADLRGALEPYPLDVAVLFGSFVRGDDHARSDLDIAVTFESGVSNEERFEYLDGLTVAITEATGIEAVDVLDLDDASPAIGYEALSTGIRVLGDESEIVALEAKFCCLTLDFEPVRREWRAALETRLEDGTYGRA